MMRSFAAAMALTLGLVWCSAAAAQPTGASSLEDCYLRVALEKSTADMVYLAREICDAVFKPAPRTLAILDRKAGRCVEWWFDARGRYESADHYCSLESDPVAGQWTLACQWKGALKSRFTHVRLRESGGRFEPVGAVRGHDVGPLFSSFASCVEQRAGPDGPARKP